MNHTWIAALSCNPARKAGGKRRRKKRYDLGTPPDGYEKTPGGGPNSYRKSRADGGYDYWYDEAGSGGTGEPPAEKAQEEKLPDWTTDAGHFVQTSFDVDGVKFKFMAHQVTAGGPFEISFAQIADGNQVFRQKSLNNRMAALKVFATTRKLTEKFIGEKNPKEFKFGAELSEPARVRLYEKLAERVEKGGKYKLVTKDVGTQKVFLFKRIDQAKGGKSPWWWPFDRRAG